MADDIDRATTHAEEALDRAILAARGVISPSIALGHPSAYECCRCGDDIPEARRVALPGVRLCVSCAERAERKGSAL